MSRDEFPAAVCVHSDGTEHPAPQDDEGRFYACEDAAGTDVRAVLVLGALGLLFGLAGGMLALAVQAVVTSW